ncbi:MAG: hypothetical protein AAFV93_06440 [Chloroflexota bacterium]
MPIKRTLLTILCVFSLVLITSAQQFDMPPESGRAFALSVTADGIQLGEIQQTFGGTIDIDYNPADPQRWARVDNFGILRFVDLGNPNIVEGTYTFSPFFDGFQAPSASENKYFMRDVEWSPDGRMLAFYSENNTISDLDQGLWFWQPIQELSTDPAYQLLRPCPQFCSAAGLPSNYAGWTVLDFEWSSDNNAILVTTEAFEYGGRRALSVRFAQRVDPPPATVAPDFLLYEYGHWSSNGQQIIVSGRGPEDTILFGSVDRSGGSPVVTLASDIGMAWVQDAVQQSDGTLVMLGSTLSENAPLQLVDGEGTRLTPPIGDSAPDSISWSPDKTAVMLTIDDAVYVASVDGTVYDITAQLDGSPNVDWVNGTLPAGFVTIPLFEPIAEGTVEPEPSEEIVSTQTFAVGDLLVVTEGVLDIYNEPASDATIVGSLTVGDELIITNAPLQSGDTTWYRVQTLDFNGWVSDTAILDYPDE